MERYKIKYIKKKRKHCKNHHRFPVDILTKQSNKQTFVNIQNCNKRQLEKSSCTYSFTSESSRVSKSGLMCLSVADRYQTAGEGGHETITAAKHCHYTREKKKKMSSMAGRPSRYLFGGNERLRLEWSGNDHRNAQPLSNPENPPKLEHSRIKALEGKAAASFWLFLSPRMGLVDPAQSHRRKRAEKMS